MNSQKIFVEVETEKIDSQEKQNDEANAESLQDRLQMVRILRFLGILRIVSMILNPIKPGLFRAP